MSEPTGSLHKKTALVVDDAAIVRQIVSKVFIEAGYAVVGAGDGDEAVNKAKFHEPDVILMDVQMPKMSGIDALRELRKDARFQTIPVIMLTGTSDSDTVKAGLELQVFDYIVKNDASTILARLHEVIEKL